MSSTYIFIIILVFVIAIVLFISIYRLVSSIRGSNIKKLFLEKRYNTLLVQLRKKIKENDNNNLSHFYLAETYYALDNFAEALPHYNKVILISKYDSDIGEVNVRERLADIYLRLERLKDAEKELLVILDKVPNNYFYNYRIGDILYTRNYRNSAKDYLLKALELNPNHVESLFRLGQICYEMNKKPEAFNYMKSCLGVDNDYLAANYYIGLVYLDSSNYLHAVQEFDKSFKDKSYRLKSLYQKGKCYYLLGDLDSSIVELERAIFYIEDDGPISLSSRYLLAKAYESKRDLPMAVSQWDIISSIDKNYMDVADKLEEYKDIRLDDNIKDFMTATNYRFDELCKGIVGSLDLNVIEYNSKGGTFSELVAIEDESKWRSQRRNKLLVKIYRSSDDISTSIVRDLIDSMKIASAYKGIIITSGTFSRSAIDYASSRPIDLYDKWKLSELLGRIKQ